MNNSENLFDADHLVKDLLESKIDSAIGTENTHLGITFRESAFQDPFNRDSEELSLIEQAIEREKKEKEEFSLSGNLFNSVTDKFYRGGSSRSFTGETENTVNQEASIAHSAERTSLRTLREQESEFDSPPVGVSNFAVAAEGRVTINGRSDFDGLPESLTDDALIYAGKGFTINGNQTLPVKRDASGNPLVDSSNRKILVDNAVAVSPLYQNLNASVTSSIYSGLIPPQIVESQTVSIPQYNQLVGERLNTHVPENSPTIEFDIRNHRMNNLSQWNNLFPAPGTATNPRVVRVIGGGLNVPSGVKLNNYAITVQQGDINFNGSNHELNNVTLIAANGNLNLNNLLATNSAIFAKQTINMNSGARFGGESLIANGSGNITFNGATVTVEAKNNLRVISAADLTFNGATSTRGQFLATNNFTFNGNSTLYGSIGAKKDITFNGNATVIGIASSVTTPPEMSINDVTVTEGDSGTQLATVTVSLSSTSSQAVTVDYTTADGTAKKGEDYGITSGTLTFAPGETAKTFSVPIIGDNLDELDESLVVNLSNASNATIIDDRGTVAIKDNDNPPEITIGDAVVLESNAETLEVEFTLSLSAPSAKEIAVDYATEEGTAKEGIDYQGLSGTLIFAPGEISKTVTVSVIGDVLDELDEAFKVKLSNANNATIGTNNATATIIDNDLPPEIAIGNISVTEGDNGTNNANFTVSLSNASSLPISVEYTTTDGTATEGVDYQAVDGILEFAPGETEKTIAVSIIGDVLDEIDEAFTIKLNNAHNATLSTTETTGTIIDNDAFPEVGIDNLSVTEGDNDKTSNASFTVSLSAASSREISIDFTTVEGTAKAGIDYAIEEGTLVFAPEEITKTISVPVLGDNLDEIDEAFSVHLTNPNFVTIKNDTGTATIIDNDVAPKLTVGDVEVSEGNNNTNQAIFTLNLDTASSLPVSVDYSTADGTAKEGEDYIASNGTVTFNPGETSHTVAVTILGDNLDEIAEAFNLNLGNAHNATILDGEAIATITNDDNPPELSVANFSVTEGEAKATITLTLDAASSKVISVDYTTVEGTATEGIDYQAKSGTLTLNPGETEKTLEIALIGDNLDEIDEAFGVNLSNPSNVILGNSQSTITIIDNDLPPSLNIGDIEVIEGNDGTTNASLIVSLDTPSSKTITVDYTTVEGTAKEGVDYQAKSGTITFAPGETSKTIDVAIIGDKLDEIDKAFGVNLSNPSNALIADDRGEVTIFDDDASPFITINDTSVTEGDAGTVNAIFTVTLASPSSRVITVDFTTVDGTAVAGIDYQTLSGTLTFNPGETTQTIEVAIIGNSKNEIDKAFSVSLNNATNATIADDSGTITIIDNDPLPGITVDGITVIEGNEGSQQALFNVSLSAISSQSVSVDFATEDGTAKEGKDYTAKEGTLTFAPGETTKTIAIEILGDNLDEANEAFHLNLSNASKGILVTPQVTGTIADDDAPPSLNIDSVIVEEGDSGTNNAVFAVNLSAPSTLPITVEYSTLDGTGRDGEDYLFSSGTLTFNPGETTKTITVPVIGDTLDEEDETFGVRLINPTNALIAEKEGTATIKDNDNAPQATINDVVIDENDGGVSVAQFTVSLSEVTSKTATVDFATADATAKAGEDYTAKEGTLTFNAGETTQTIEIEVKGDTVDEVDETFLVNLSNEVNIVINDGEGRGKIIDDDQLITTPGGILLTEGNNFRVEHAQPITIPATSSVLKITYSDLNFDTTDTHSINDALEIALVDSEGNSLVHTIGDLRDACFNLTEGESPHLTPGVTLENQTIKINLTDVAPNTSANLIVRLVNNDGDVNTSVRIDEIKIDSGDGISPVAITNNETLADSATPINFASLDDVSPSITPQYQQTSFNEETNTLTAAVALANEGTYHLNGSLIVAVKNLSDPNIRVIDADGVTLDGLPYYDFSNLIAEGRLAPGESSQVKEISFDNPDRIQFTYELVVLSQLNSKPTITSQSDTEIVAGRAYSYQVTAEDSDGDTISYRLLTAPNGMNIDETTGLIDWETTTADIANHAIVVEVNDGRGGKDLQTFNLAVIEAPANRPPQFTTTPVVDAYINQPYNYDANATDPDSDALDYEVVAAPEGLTIDPSTGEVEWTPPDGVVLGDTVIGQISFPGEKDEFTFSGLAGQQIYFDPLQYSGSSSNWSFTVVSPNGTKIVDTNLNYSNNQLIQLSETGNYRVVVDATNSVTGSYGFSVADVALVPIAPLDTEISGQLSPGSEDDLYRFTGVKGQRIFIDKISSSGSLDWVLYDAKNEVLTSDSSMNDMEVVLPQNGEYKLALRGQANFTSKVNYTFKIITPDEVTAEMTLGSINTPHTVTGTILEKGEQDYYTFAGTVGQALFFDRLSFNSTSNVSHTISLTDPRGETVWTRNLYNDDDSKPIVLSEDGIYTVKIDASGENTGTYSFNLLDFALATPIELDTSYTNTLNPGQEAHIYRFDSVKGQRLFIDSIQASAAGTWRLFNSSWQEVHADSSADTELVLSQSDTYYLMLQGNKDNSATYQFKVVTPEDNTATMDLGDIDTPRTVTGAIVEKGERDYYTFTGTVGQSIFFDGISFNGSNNNAHSINLINPRGETVWTSSFSGSDNTTPILLAENGTYRIQIAPRGENTGTYSFNLLDFNRAKEISLNTSYTNTLNPGQETHLYKFNGVANQRLYLDSSGATSGITWILYDVNNKAVETKSFSSDIESVLDHTGTYILAIRGESNNPVNYTFNASIPNLITEELVLDQPITGAINQKGEQDVYTFTGVKGQKLFLDNLISSNNLTATLIDPRGYKVFDSAASLSGDTSRHPFDLPLSGIYRLIIDGNNDTTSNYNFQLVDLNNASEIDITSPVTNVLNPGSSIQVYKLSGYQGINLSFQAAANNSSVPNWLLYSPGNNQLVDKNLNQSFNHSFTANGTHYLIIRGDGSLTDTFNYQFSITATTAPTTGMTGTAYQIGETVSGDTIALTLPGEQDNYIFEGTAGDVLSFDSLKDLSTNIKWKLTDSNNKVIFNSDEETDQVVTLTETGKYLLNFAEKTVNSTVESYGFRVLNWSDADQLNKDTVVNGDFGVSKRETDLYRFTGAAGERIFFNSLAGDTFNYWGLYTDRGVQLDWVQLSSSTDFARNLPYTGEYLIALSGNDRTNNAYSFELVTNQWSTSNYTIGETVSGTSIAIHEPGDRDDYTFEATAGEILYFDALKDTSTYIDWKLTDPNSKEIFNDNAYSDQLKTLTKTGTYTLNFDGQDTNDEVDSYGFRVLNWSDVPQINKDTVINGDFGANKRENDLYRFTGVAGEKLLFDRTSGSSSNSWGLYNSRGKLISDALELKSLSNDFEYTLPTTDEYVLRLNGSGNNDSTYSFQIASSELLTASLTLNEVVESEIVKAGEEDTYTFEGVIGQKLLLDTLNGLATLKAKLYSPTDKLVFEQATDVNNAPFTLTETGIYRLVIDGDNTATGSYKFLLSDIAAATPLDFSTPLNGSLANGKATNLYRLDGTQGQVLNFNLNAASWNGANWILYDAGNKALAQPPANNPDFQVILPSNGTYTLAIVGSSNNPVTYGFEVTDVTPTSIANTGLNTVYSGTLAAGSTNDHLFNAKAGTQIFFDGLNSSNSNLRARLVNPNGSYIFEHQVALSDRGVLVLPQTGAYKLQIYGSFSTVTGNYNFQILELPQNITENPHQSLALNAVTNGTLNPGLESNVYSFAGKVGQQILFNGMSGSNVSAKFYEPNGTALYTLSNYGHQNSELKTLSQDGIYHLIISGRQATNRNYSFQMLNFGFGSNLDFNRTISGSLTNGQQNQLYKFTATAGSKLYFDNISGSTNIALKIYEPGNHTVLKTTYLHPDYDFEVDLPSDGTYTVSLEGGSVSTPVNYSFRPLLLSSQESSIIVPGTGENANASDGSLGLFPVKLAATDAEGAIAIQEYNIRLLPDPDNSAPIIISTPNDKYAINQGVYRYQIDAIDPNEDTLTYRLIDSPAGALIDQDTGELLWFPTNVAVGQTYSFTVEVADGRGGIDQQSFSVGVSQALGKIQGLVFEDLNANGIPDTKLLQGDNPDIFFVIDASGSMGNSSVNWLTADVTAISQQQLSPLDQELGSVLALAEFTIAQGRGNETQFGILTSGQSVIDMNPFEAGIQETTTAEADSNNNGIIDIREVIQGGVGQGGSDTSGIETAWELHQALPGDANIVFMSDGYISVDKQLVAEAQAEGVNITAFGFAEGGMDTMRLVDPDAVLINNPQEIIEIFSGLDARYIGEPLMEGTSVYLDLNNNGAWDENEPKQISRVDNSISQLGKHHFTFTFNNLLPGTYTLRQIVPNGYSETTPSTGAFVNTITVSAGETEVNLFGNHLLEPLPNTNPHFTNNVNTTELVVGELFEYRATASDADGDKLAYELTLAPDGMVVDESTGTVVWQPKTGQEGTAKAILRVNDGQGGVDIQYFEIEVKAANNAPVFTSQPQNTKPQVGKTFNYRAVAIDADSDPLTYELVTGSPTGVTINSSTGQVSWTPVSSQLAAREITIKVSDNKGGAATQTLNLEVIAAQPNQAPQFTSTPRNNARIGSNYFYQPTASDPDGDSLSFKLLTTPSGMVMDKDGRIIWSPAANQFGQNAVKVEVSDGFGGKATQSFNIYASDRASNNLPTITSTPITKTNTEKLYTYKPTANDPDGDYLLWSLDNAPTGMVIDPTTGSISWQPNLQQIGIHTVAVRVTDALGATVGQEFTLKVTGVNTPPNIVSTPITNGAINQSYSYQVAATDLESDPLRYSLGVHPEGMIIDEKTGLITWTPKSVGNYQTEVIVLDTQGASNRQLFSVEVGTSAINHAPVISSTPGFVADVNTAYTYSVVASDSDGDALNYNLIAAPNGMSIDGATGEVTWNAPVLGTHQVVVEVNDGRSGAAQGYTLTVRKNLPPVINLSTPPQTTATPGETYKYDIKAYDPNGESLTYTLDPTSINKGITIDEWGRLRWTPKPIDVGNHPITITIIDETGAETLQSFTLNVLADTQAPKVRLQPGNIFVVDGQFQAELNSTVAFQTLATDNIGVTGLQLLVNNTPVELNANGIANVNFNQLGIIQLKALAYDAAGNIGQATTTVEVFDADDVDAPTVSINLGEIEDNLVTAPIEIKGTIEDNNLKNYVLEYAVAGSDEFTEIARGTTNITDGVIGTFDPSILANDAYTIRLTAVDNGGNFATSEETVYVEGELKLGNFQLSFTDLTIPVAGIPISVTRTYDTLTANSRDDFGYGWRLEFRDTNLRTSLATDETFDTFDITSVGFREGDKVYITLPGGKRETFTFKPELDRLGAMLQGFAGNAGLAAGGKDYGLYHPAFVSQSNSNNKLTVSDFLLVRGKDGQFAGIAGGLYNPANAAYGGKYTLTTSEGIKYEINGQTGDLLTATDTNKNQLTFSEAGITSNTGVNVKFARDAQGRIVSVIDPEGNQVKYQYDSQGDLIAVTDREENTTSFKYNDARAHYLNEIIDPLGRSGVKTEYDADGRLSRVIDVNGEAVELNYDTDNSVQTTKDVFGHQTTYVYDDRGNVLTEVDAVGKVTKRTYDKDDNVLTETIVTEESGEEGYTTTYTYDSKGNQLSETDALGNVTRYSYDSKGHILSETDALGNTTTNTYDGRGNLLTSKDAAGNFTNYNYDSRGNLISLVDPAGNKSGFSYDSQGNVTKVVDALGNETNYTYDKNGNQLTETKKVTTKNGVETVVTQNQYDSSGNLLSVTDALGNITLYEYDELNRQTAVIDPLGRRTKYRYDEAGNLVETIYPDNTPDDSSDNPRTKTEYDAAGREIATTDAAGRITKSVYDAVGNLIETIYPDSTPNILTDNPRTKTEYFQNGRAKAEIDEKGHRTEYVYDADGRLIKIIYPQVSGTTTQATTTYEYDKLGRRISQTNALGHTTKSVYDDLGRLVRTIFADGTFTSNSYDILGRKIASTDQNGKVTEYRYDTTSQLTGVKDANSNWTNYTYTPQGNLLSITDANGHSNTYEYDILGRKVATILPLGQRSTTAYDALNNVISTTDFNGKTTTYKYDPQNRLIEQDFASDPTVTMTYTASGQVATITDGRGLTSFSYDEQDRLLSRTDVDGSSISYTYDKAGNRTSVTTQVLNGNPHTTYYTFDERARLDNVLSGNQVLADYDYDVANNLVKTQYSNGVIETREYDKLNHLLNLQTNKENNLLTNFTYTLDKVGNRQQVVESLGNNSRTVNYTYDDLYRLTKEQVTDAANGNITTEFIYDLVGNRKQQKVTENNIVTNTTYQYDANDRLLKEQLNGSDKVLYTYDNNGNTLTRTEDGKTTESIWNDQNRLAGVNIKDVNGVVIQNVGYEYDSSGIRVSQNVDGEITKYLIDANLPYAQALVEYRPSGLAVVSYTHGNDLISQTRDGESSFYHVDGLGSTRGLSDDSGNLIDTYNYKAFGELLNSSGGSENNYLFAGEQLDPVLGDYYNRARYYDPQTGRFTKRDSHSGNIVEPPTLHKYIYTSNNPVNFIDPTGLYTLSDVSASFSMLNQLAAQMYFSVNSVVLEKAVSWATILSASAAIGVIGSVVEKVKSDGSPDIKIFPDEWFEKPKPKNEPKYYDDLDGMAQLRVQVQDAPGHTLGIPMYNLAEVGVTVGQVYQAVGQLWKKREYTTSWLPKDYDTMFIGGMAFITKAAAKIQENQGTSGKGGEQLATYQWDKKVYSVKGAFTSYGSTNKKQYYRFDLENIRKRNLMNE
jgi:RHS repeat-associated protein